MVPWTILCPQSKRYHNRFNSYRTGDRRLSLFCTMGALFPQNCPFPLEGGLDPNTAHDSLRPSEPTTQAACSVVFCTDDRRVSLYFTMRRPFSSSKLSLLIGGSGPSCNTWFPGPTGVLSSKGKFTKQHPVNNCIGGN